MTSSLRFRFVRSVTEKISYSYVTDVTKGKYFLLFAVVCM